MDLWVSNNEDMRNYQWCIELKDNIKFLFKEVACNRIFARHDVHNPNSGKVMKKSGLLYEGTLLEAGKNNTGICDMAVYGITRNVYSMEKGEEK